MKSLQTCVQRRDMHCEYNSTRSSWRFTVLGSLLVAFLNYLCAYLKHLSTLLRFRTDVLTDFTTLVSELDLPAGVMAVLLDGMSGVEHRLAFGTDEKLQAASLVGVFVQARHMMKVA